METVATQMPDGTVLPVRMLPAKGPHFHEPSGDVVAPVIVVMPGLGVGGRIGESSLELGELPAQRVGGLEQRGTS